MRFFHKIKVKNEIIKKNIKIKFQEHLIFMVNSKYNFKNCKF